MKKVFCAVTSLFVMLGLIFTGCTQSGSQMGGREDHASGGSVSQKRNIRSVLLTNEVSELGQFSEGYASVYLNSGLSYIINTEGEICGTFNGWLEPFKSGVSTGENCVVDTSGKILYDAGVNGEQILNVTAEGNILVLKKENTVDGINVDVCVKDRTGNTVLDWKALDFDAKEVSEGFSADSLGEDVFLVYGRYAGASASYPSQSSYFFNAGNGACVKAGNTSSASEFQNGKRIYMEEDYYKEEGFFGLVDHYDAWVSIDAQTLTVAGIKKAADVNKALDESLNKRPGFYPTYRISEYGDNGLLSIEYSQFGTAYYVGYCDEKLDLKIDLTAKYHRVLFASAFENGIAVLGVRNNGGVPFVVAIDEQGNEIFTPIEAGVNSEEFYLGCNNDVIFYEKDGKIHFVDKKTGSAISSARGIRCTIGDNGIAVIQTDDYDEYYFDISSGTELFGTGYSKQ